MARDPYTYFRLEARELLSDLGAGILEIEKHGNSSERIHRLLRLAHTLKGAARIVKQIEIGDLAHEIENILTPYQEVAGELPRAEIDSYLKAVDEITAFVSALTPPDNLEVQTPIKNISLVDDSLRTVRVDIAEMDAVLEGVVEAHTLLNSLRGAPMELERIRQLATLLLAQIAPRHSAGSVQRSPESLAGVHSTAEELRRRIDGAKTTLDLSMDQIDRELQQLQEAVEQLRLVSAGTLFNPLERLARDVAVALGKQVIYESSGGDIRLDASVLEKVQGALVQIIRNGVAHGIETESERRANGKPAAGRITLDVSRRARMVVFQISDDGRGINLDAVHTAAQSRGLLLRDAKAPSKEDILRILLSGGISTSETVTDISGRGIGLDVVRESIARLGGKVQVTTEPARGTTFELAVPFSVASLDALVVEASGNIMTIPLDAVQSSMRFGSHDILWTANGASVLHEEVAIPFIPLSSALFGAQPALDQSWSTVVISVDGKRAAIGVDSLHGTTRIVIRSFSDLVPINPMVTGASFDAEGNPQLVLDPDGLLQKAWEGGFLGTKPNSSGNVILVIDDSLTTRMLEQSVLESAGYEVDTCASAEEGLQQLQGKRYALILVDVEMPGMNGFTFIQTIRADPAFHDIPAILVTSRAAPEDIQRGKDVGAQGYLVKSEFDQTKLLAMIRSLAG